MTSAIFFNPHIVVIISSQCSTILRSQPMMYVQFDCVLHAVLNKALYRNAWKIITQEKGVQTTAKQ